VRKIRKVEKGQAVFDGVGHSQRKHKNYGGLPSREKENEKQAMGGEWGGSGKGVIFQEVGELCTGAKLGEKGTPRNSFPRKVRTPRRESSLSRIG